MSTAPSQDFDGNRLIDLIGRLCDHEINEEELLEVETTLANSQQARELYHLTVAVHRDLGACEIVSARDEVVPSERTQRDTRERKQPRRISVLRLAIAASVLVALSAAMAYLATQSNDPIASRTVVATVTDLIEVDWSDESAKPGIGDDVPRQRLQLSSGTICLQYVHGVVVTVDGPADLEVVSKDLLRLHRGQMAAYVPDGAEGFRVVTNSADIVDLGTEFGVTVGDDGSSELIVFDGEVEFSTANFESEAPKRVTAGLAYHIDSDGHATLADYRQSGFEESRSLLRRKQVIREPFRSDSSFPGTQRAGWKAGWSIDSENVVIDEAASGVRSESPLFRGMQNYLVISGETGHDVALAKYRLFRSFASYERFDATEPYTIEFAFRLDSTPESIRRIRVAAFDGEDSTSSDRELWQVRTRRALPNSETLDWRVYHPDDESGPFSTMPVRQGTAYRFLIEVDPVIGRWRASISNGEQTIWNTLRNGSPLRLRTDNSLDDCTLQWEVTADPGAPIRFSLDAIRIQNRPQYSVAN